MKAPIHLAVVHFGLDTLLPTYPRWSPSGPDEKGLDILPFTAAMVALTDSIAHYCTIGLG